MGIGTTRAYDEIINFLAAGTTPTGLAEYHPSEGAEQRVALLLEREKSDGLSPDEPSELDHYQHLEHLMRLTKARARLFATGGGGIPGPDLVR